ncbi:cellulose synthase subunit BcsC-related outer membrane protein, partial [Salmonella enterica subsp. enterica serovar Anatum]|nr:cellulose synthase subunit BcsC-related outer membrane protein [Salmonella enterica subsp. enterica serovar Anatum]
QRPTNCFGKLGYNWTDSTPVVSLLETLDALSEFQRAGKIRYIWMTGYYYKVINENNRRVTVGLNNMIWHYDKDLSGYSLGQGGY